MVRNSLGIAALVATVAAIPAPAHPGTFFRLEVGPPIAAGAAIKDKKTAFVVRPRLCDDERSVRVSGSAEGMVNGARQSITLRVQPLSTPGVHAVSQQWGEQGAWVVHLVGTCPATGAVTSALIPVKGPAFVRQRIELLPQAATQAQVEAAVADYAGTSR